MLSPASPLIQKLAKHLDARADRLRRLLQTDDLDLVADLHHAALDTSRHHRPAARYRENIFDRHQERQILRALGRRYVRIDRIHQRVDRTDRRLAGLALKSLQRRPRYDRDVVAGKIVTRQQLPNLELHKLEQLGIVDLIDLVQINDDRRNAHLTRQKYVLPRLRHRSVRRGHNQDRTVHLRRARDHVLHVIRMTGTVHVRVVASTRLVLDVRRRDRDPAVPLLGRLVDLVVRRERRAAGRLRQNLRDRRRQRRLAVIDMTDRPNVRMRLRPLKTLLRHRLSPYARPFTGGNFPQPDRRRSYAAPARTSSATTCGTGS